MLNRTSQLESVSSMIYSLIGPVVRINPDEVNVRDKDLYLQV